MDTKNKEIRKEKGGGCNRVDNALDTTNHENFSKVLRSSNLGPRPEP